MPAEDYPWHWSVYRWLTGQNPVLGGMPDPNGFAMDLAEFVTALRRIDPADGPPAYRGGPLAEGRGDAQCYRGPRQNDRHGSGHRGLG
jgi:aminoglycoside phosphotransferase (APT) family kinase protein